MPTSTRDRTGELRAILNDEMIATDPEELERALHEHLRDPLVAAIFAGAYVNRFRLFLRAQADNERLQERTREALAKIEALEGTVRKMRRENPNPLAVFLMLNGPGHALVAVRGAVEPVEVTAAFAQNPPAPGTYCLIDDEGFLSERTGLLLSHVPGVVRAVEGVDVAVEVNGREVSATVNAKLDSALGVGDKVNVLETSGMAMVIGRRAKSSEEALSRYPRIVPWEGGFGAAAPLRHDLREAALQRIVLPLRHPALARQVGVAVPVLVLLCGPSRTGKTVCVRCLAAEMGVPAFSVNISNVGSEYVSVTPRQLHGAAEFALQLSAEKQQPVLLLLDDGEQLARQRGSLQHSSGWHDDVTGTLLGIVDHLEQHRGRVCIILISNREDLLDTAVVKRADQQLRFTLPGQSEYAAVWHYELDRLDATVRPAEPDAAVEALAAEVYTDSAWVGEIMGKPALQLVAPAQLIDCAVPRLALAEARGVTFARAVRDGHVSPMDLNLLRTCQRKILVDAYRQAIKRAAGGRFSDLNLLALQPREREGSA